VEEAERGGAGARRTVMVQKEVEASIAALMEALSDPPEAEDPFAQGANKEQKQGESGGGGGGQQPGGQRVPPMAELRLLRTMAQRVLDDTAAASELPEGDRAAYLSRVAQRQKRIMDLGERWMTDAFKSVIRTTTGEFFDCLHWIFTRYRQHRMRCTELTGHREFFFGSI
jgi:hypothetical protein